MPKNKNKKPLIKDSSLFWLGATMLGGGLTVASPVDEIALAVGTAGVGIAAAPIQGPATLLGGLGSALVGIVLMVASTVDRD